MRLDKNSSLSDAFANLYRAAFFLASDKRQEKLALRLIKKAKSQFVQHKFFRISKTLDSLLKKETNRLILAERVLDEFLKNTGFTGSEL